MAILILLVLIALNAVLVMSELAVVSARKVRLEQAAAKGSRGAKIALTLAASPTRFLSTVQGGITLIAIVSGAFGEAALSEHFTKAVEKVPWLGDHSHAIATVLVVLIITYLSLVIGELVPKRLALNAPERIATTVAPPMQALSRIFGPVVHFLSFSTDLILRIFPKKAEGAEIVTEEEIRGLIEQGTEAGVFNEQERELVDRVFRLGDQRVASLMVSRRDIVWLEADSSVDRIRLAVATSSHSHFPVCRGGLDHLIGVVHLKDMIQSGLLTQRIDLRILARKPLFVPEAMPVLKLIDEFRRSQQHIAFILDEYGVLAGLVTLNDVVQGMLGQIGRAGEDADPSAVQREDGSWLLDGSLPVEELRELMEADSLPHEDRTSFQTLGGFVMTYLGRVPRTGDSFAYDRFKFEVVDMDRHRVDKVMLSFTGPKSPSDEAASDARKI